MNPSRRLLSLARDGRLSLGATILFGLLAGLLTIGQASALSRVVEGVFLGGQTLPGVRGILFLLLIIVLLRAMLAWGSEVSANALAVRIKSDLRQRLYDKLLSLGPAYTRGERTGELVNAATEGVEALDAYFSQYLPQLVIATLVPFCILLFVFPHDPLSGLILFLTAPLIPIFMYLIGKTAERITKRQWDTLGGLSAHFLDSLQGLTTLKEFGQSKQHARSIAETSDRFRDVTLGVLRITFLSALVLELVATISTALIAVEVGLRLIYGHLAFGQAFFLLLLAPEFYIPLRMLGLRFHAGMAGTAAARRIFEILDVPEEGDQENRYRVDKYQVNRNQVSPPDTCLPAYLITFDHLSYTYPGDIQPALHGITLEIKAGEHVALVGSSGAGKSTLAALLLRFIEPTHGQITITHEPFTPLSPETWHELIAWVPQTSYLFHDTLEANLRLARPEATDEQLDAAVKAAHLDGFIQSLPSGYQTVIGEEGAHLSGGEAQRLALARAFLKDAPILILDETTSHLDPQTESLLAESIHCLMQGRTVITIAHRLNTVFQADRIFVLEKGRLVETGTHEELMSRHGRYAALVNVPFGVKSQRSRVSTDFRHPTFDSPPSAALQSPIFNPQSSIPQSSILRLLSFLRGSWARVALSVLLGVLTVGSNVGLMATSAFLISAAALHPELAALQLAIVGVRFFGISRGVFRYAERLSTHDVTFRLLARLRTWFYQAIEPLAPARLMQYRSGDLLSRIVADVGTLENFYVRAVAPPLVAGVVTVGMTVFFGQYEAGLAWLYLAFMLALGAGVPVLAWLLSRRPGADLISSRAGLHARLVDGIQGLAELLSFGRGKEYARRLKADSETYGKAQRRFAFIVGLSAALTVLLVNLGMLAVLAVDIQLVAAGRLPGVMLAVLTLAALAGFEAVMPLPLAAQTLASSMKAARRLFEVVDAEPAVREQASGFRYRVNGLLPVNLEVSHLSFTYPGASRPALEKVSFTLHPGKRVAIVGPSGAGKSTLANLLLRFWDYSQGQILLNGHELHEYDPEEVRKRISLLSQRAHFFNDTVYRNLILARPSASQADVWEAARQAQIHEFISGLPDEYETMIGERGLRLSGGERQRLALARTLLKDAPLLLLDEPTANLDPATEHLILDSLFDSGRGRSLLLITHRLVGLDAMDEILVLEQGRVVERGTHAGLLQGNGLYRCMWELQNRSSLLAESQLDIPHPLK